MSLLPLNNSHTVGDIEKELQALQIDLFKQFQQAQFDEINVYGMPHLGSFSLIERISTQDGIIIIRQGDEARLRYLFKAWKGRNPERGLHFLKTYCQVLWGQDNYFINQLWQNKYIEYTKDLKILEELDWQGLSRHSYFLTSRVLVDIDTDIIPETIIKALRSIVPARIHIKMRLAKFGRGGVQLGSVLGARNYLKANGEGIAPSRDRFGFGGINGAVISGGTSIFKGFGEGRVPPDIRYGAGVVAIYGNTGGMSSVFVGSGSGVRGEQSHQGTGEVQAFGGFSASNILFGLGNLEN